MEMGNKRIAALTMLRNDEVFLRKWVAYYGAQLGKENLYVWFDGLDQVVPDFCEGVNVQVVEHIEGNVKQGDRGRIDFLSARAAELFECYDLVIGTDVDEFLVVDPALGVPLADFLSSLDSRRRACFSGLGVDVGQHLDKEAVIDWERPLLSQRGFARLSTRYTKASVLARPLPWGSGFHRVRGRNFHIVPDLYLFHFGCVDLERIKSRMSDADRIASGWSKHLKKRARTIDVVTHGKAREWSCAVPFARTVQTIFRPPYAWNKPSMFELKLVVRIPERFSSAV